MKEESETVYILDEYDKTLRPVKVVEKVGVFLGTLVGEVGKKSVLTVDLNSNKDLTGTSPLIFDDMEALKKHLPANSKDIKMWTDSGVSMVVRTFKMVE